MGRLRFQRPTGCQTIPRLETVTGPDDRLPSGSGTFDETHSLLQSTVGSGSKKDKFVPVNDFSSFVIFC
ncbi:hypothetical protein SprV_0200671600 [Sparganum proliferum]